MRDAHPDEHEHIVDLEQRNLLCTCHGCFLLLTPTAAGGLRYRAVPGRYLAFPDFELSPGQWDSLQIPVSVAFFFVNFEPSSRSPPSTRSPAGATESLLPLDAWDDIVDEPIPDLATLLPDVEAFLVRPERPGGDRRSAASCPSTPATRWSGISGSCGSRLRRRARRRTTRSMHASSTGSGAESVPGEERRP